MEFVGGDADLDEWWLRSPANRWGHVDNACGENGSVDGHQAVDREFGVRPALCLDLEAVTFIDVNLSGGANSTASGVDSLPKNTFYLNDSVPELSITYTANEGYVFPESSDYYGTKNGVTVTRVSDTEVALSGIPTGFVNMAIPAAMQIATVSKVPEAKKSLTYTGKAQKLVDGGQAEGGTLKYALGKDASNVPTTGWSTTIPTATDPGTYYVWYKVDGDSEHADSKATCMKVEIAKSQAKVIKAPTANSSLTYNGKAQKLASAGKTEGGTLKYALGKDASNVPTKGWSTAVPTATKPGTYYVWYKVEGDGAHVGSKATCIKV